MVLGHSDIDSAGTGDAAPAVGVPSRPGNPLIDGFLLETYRAT